MRDIERFVDDDVRRRDGRFMFFLWLVAFVANTAAICMSPFWSITLFISTPLAIYCAYMGVKSWKKWRS